MKSTLKNKKLGDYIHQVDIRNKNLEVQTLLGVSNEKYFMPSIANIVGTDLSSYKIVKYNGAIVSKELLSTDTYSALERIIKKGSKKVQGVSAEVQEDVKESAMNELNPELLEAIKELE